MTLRSWRAGLVVLVGVHCASPEGARDIPDATTPVAVARDGGDGGDAEAAAIDEGSAADAGGGGDAGAPVGDGGAAADATLDDAASAPGEAGTGTDAGAAADDDSEGGILDAQAVVPRACEPHCADVLTWHNDNARTGQNLAETVLTPANVNAATFGVVFFLPVDGKVDAQPLVVSSLSIPGKGVHDVLYVATEHDSLYAFDADDHAGDNAAPLWQVSLLPAGSGETPSEDRFDCGQVAPEIGITATPVIDVSTDTMYVVAMSKSATRYFQRLHAIDIASGAERPGSPVDVEATYPGTGDNSTNGTVVFDPAYYKERAALLLSKGTIYLSWASHGDHVPYTGWLMAYDEATLTQRAVLDITPNGSGGSFWGSGAGPAADDDGVIYAVAANGTFDPALDPSGFPAQRDFGNAIVRITDTGTLAVTDYFTPWDTIAQSAQDLDFGSGAAMLLPDEVGSPAHPHLVIGAGKAGNVYLVDRDHMGKWNGPDSGSNSQIVEELTGAVPQSMFGSPAYFDHAVYYGDNGNAFKRFPIDGAELAMKPDTITYTSFYYPGTTPSISANGAAPDPAATAVVWAVQNASPAVLYAYAADDLLDPLYTSAQADGGRDVFGDGNKFIVPTIANGHVYVATTTGVGVFGLLH